MSKKTLTLDNLRSPDGRPIRANIMAKMIKELDALPFGTVTDSISSLAAVQGTPAGTYTSYSKAQELRSRRFEVQNKRYVYGSLETMDALRAGEGK